MNGKLRKPGIYGHIYPSSPIREIVATLQGAIAAEESGEWLDIKVQKDLDSETPAWEITGTRWETDRELEVRLKREKEFAEREAKVKAKEKLDREKNDLKEYKRLKKKFEGK